MEDGDIKLHESLAIMRYILERYGELYTPSPPHCKSDGSEGSISGSPAAQACHHRGSWYYSSVILLALDGLQHGFFA